MFFFCITFSMVASAQTLEQARAWFTKQEYEKAKPVFQRYVKSHPGNANYNYWYGVCCVQTGEAAKSIKHLEMARSRKIQNAPLYLGKAYDEVYRFEEAVSAYEDYIEVLEKRKQSTESVQTQLNKSRISARMLKGVEEVCVIDSIIVDKDKFLKAYRVSEESGSIYTFNEFFGMTGANEGTVYETELKNKIYYSELGDDNTMNIYSRSKMFDEWGRAHLLPGSINAGANSNYPFLLTDGITIYYASDGEGSMGGYDIFVTRYNTETDTYLTPENVGMPFNSPFNDYMFVIDEYNDLGWFATDRYQPEGKVCIYVFVPNASKLTYNYEAMDFEVIRGLAELRSIEDTWKDEEIVEAARKRLKEALNKNTQEDRAHDFEFIINDRLTYYSVNEFKSAKAKSLIKAFLQMEKDYKQQADKLNSQRKWYSEASKQEQQRTSPAILDLEKRVYEMEKELNKQEIVIRNEEIKTLKR